MNRSWMADVTDKGVLCPLHVKCENTAGRWETREVKSEGLAGPVSPRSGLGFYLSGMHSLDIFFKEGG